MKRECNYQKRICENCGEEYTPVSASQKSCKKCVTKKCILCGKEYEEKHITNNRKYCSAACWGMTRRKRGIGECVVCGKKFSYKKSNAIGKYCSRECTYKGQKGKLNSGLICGHNKKRKLTTKRKEEILKRAIEKPSLPLFSFFKQFGYKRTPRLDRECPETYKQYMELKRTTRKFTGGTNYRRGMYTERIAKKELEKEGYLVVRSGRSLGMFDLIAIGRDDVLLIQVKRSKEKRGLSRYEEEIKKIKEFRAPLVCKKMLWIWRDHYAWEKYDI